MIIRSYACDQCAYMMEIELRADEWAAEPPDCPRCSERTHQEFKPPAIGGSDRARAVRLAEDIMANDYNVADFKSDGRQGGTPKVRYKDATPTPPSSWSMQDASFAQALALGRENRRQFGDGLDVLKANLKSGAQTDLIAASKRRSMRIY